MLEFSILCLERHNIENALPKVLPLVDSVHLDIMDGTFVAPDIFSPEQVNAFQSDLPKHVHLMGIDPDGIFRRLNGVASFSFHYEAVGAGHHQAMLERIRARGVAAGIVLNPETDVAEIADLMPFIDRVVLMAVTPGFSGQKYIPETSRKIITLRKMSKTVDIIIDGGMNDDTMREVMTLGANACVVCSVIMRSFDWEEKINHLRASINIGVDHHAILESSP